MECSFIFEKWNLYFYFQVLLIEIWDLNIYFFLDVKMCTFLGQDLINFIALFTCLEIVINFMIMYLLEFFRYATISGSSPADKISMNPVIIITKLMPPEYKSIPVTLTCIIYMCIFFELKLLRKGDMCWIYWPGIWVSSWHWTICVDRTRNEVSILNGRLVAHSHCFFLVFFAMIFHYLLKYRGVVDMAYVSILDNLYVLCDSSCLSKIVIYIYIYSP